MCVSLTFARRLGGDDQRRRAVMTPEALETYQQDLAVLRDFTGKGRLGRPVAQWC